MSHCLGHSSTIHTATINALNSLLHQLTDSWWGTNNVVLRTSALALCYSCAKFCALLFMHASHFLLHSIYTIWFLGHSERHRATCHPPGKMVLRFTYELLRLIICCTLSWLLVPVPNEDSSHKHSATHVGLRLLSMSISGPQKIVGDFEHRRR